MKIGIVGVGYVGRALLEGFQGFQIGTYDINGNCNFSSIEQLCKFAGIVFVCVPTPMTKSGKCDTSIVESVVAEINDAAQNNIVVIKSTVPPGTTKKMSSLYDKINLVFSPEFLTEANYVNDFKDCNRVIFGGNHQYTSILESAYKTIYPDKIYIHTDPTTAEMVKYFANTFLATKVAFANEMYDVCVGAGLNYDVVAKYATMDSRLGNSHWKVPGPDGKRGFGGSCFPKDINALISFCSERKVEVPLISTVWEKNLKVRPERDWERLVGRAVVGDKTDD